MSDFIERLEELRKKSPSALTEADREFLMARRSYLNADEMIALGLETAAPTTEPDAGIPAASQPSPKARGRRSMSTPSKAK